LNGKVGLEKEEGGPRRGFGAPGASGAGKQTVREKKTKEKKQKKNSRKKNDKPFKGLGRNGKGKAPGGLSLALTN